MDNTNTECKRGASRISLILGSQDQTIEELTFFRFTCDLCGREIELEMPNELLPLDKLTENDIKTIKKICSCCYDDSSIAKYFRETPI